MSENLDTKEILNITDSYSSKFDYSKKETVIILAAGHGKRIKSHTSKMLHEIWGVPTVERVYDACRKGLGDINIIVVVGIKAESVTEVIGSRKNTLFAYQGEQKGTGHALQIAMEKIDPEKYDGTIYVLPGDMGLIDDATMKLFRDEYSKSDNDMMVLTGIYEGDSSENSYGRIVRAKSADKSGNTASSLEGQVIQIIEHKDILKIEDSHPYVLPFKGKEFSYSRHELIENCEFNSGVYAFDYKKLVPLAKNIESNNAQNEIYITDLIELFNKAMFKVGAVSPKQQYVLMGFNNKSVLKQMDQLARKIAYEKIKDIVEIADSDDFFIDDLVIEDILKLDREGKPLDIKIGKGVYLGRGVKLNYKSELGKNVYVSGNIVIGENVCISENVHLSCFKGQELRLGNNVKILSGNIIKGNIVIGENTVIESSVNMTGSDEFPLRIGKNVDVKGTSYIFGSIIDDDISIEHSIIVRKRVERLVKKNGTIQKIKYFLPMPEGLDAIESIS